MFSGIIEELGGVSSLSANASGARIVVSAEIVTKDTIAGDSISVNGVCLTALDITPHS
ncbi:MAG: riboflavin synthase, partial [Acidobacteria bacterium]|nr:riboflavin synthase [Acidobacteriota bacterium]